MRSLHLLLPDEDVVEDVHQGLDMKLIDVLVVVELQVLVRFRRGEVVRVDATSWVLAEGRDEILVEFPLLLIQVQAEVGQVNSIVKDIQLRVLVVEDVIDLLNPKLLR